MVGYKVPRDFKRIAAAIVLLALAQLAIAGDCVKTGSRCADSTPCKTISGVNVCLAGVALPAGGLSVPDTCWDFEDTYNCMSPQQIDDCQPLRDRGCGQIGSKCLTTDSNGNCTMYEQTYQCQTSPAQTQQVTDCSAQGFCMDGKCFDTSHPPDSDIFKAATAMEAAREAGLYMDPNSQEMFKGYSGGCRKGYGGIRNCCKTDTQGGAGMSNNLLFSTAGQVVSNGVSYAGYIATPYVYDALYASDSPMLIGEATKMAQNFWDHNSAYNPATDQMETTFCPNFSFMGVGWTSAATAPDAMIGTNTVINGAGSSLEGMSGTLYFNPVTFYIAIAIMVYQELSSCEQDEMILGEKRGQNLCHFAGSYCSNKFLGTCLETTESYCCFNSRLARIINEQGRPQLGKVWGSGETPDCSDFTPAQLQSLDFSKMDLSEFYAEIMANMKTPDISQASQKARDTVTNKVNYYYSK